MLKAAPQPKVAEWLLRAPGKPSCLDPGKKDYEVKELEAAYGCRDADSGKVRAQLNSLQKVVKDLQKDPAK